MNLLNSLNLDWLRTFVTFCESPNIYEAATTLGLSQPAVTVQLQRLEHALSAQLFSRDGKKKILTPIGQGLFKEARARLKDLEASMTRFVDFREDLHLCRLRVGVRHELFAQAIETLQFPGTLELMAMSVPQAFEALRAHEVECAFLHQAPPGKNWVSVPLISNQAVLLVHRELPCRKPPDLKWVRAHPCYLYREDAPLLRPWLESLGGELGDLQVKLICEDWDVLVRAMQAHRGYAVVPSDIAADPKVFKRFPIAEGLVPQVQFTAVFASSLHAHPAFSQYLTQLSRRRAVPA